MLYWITLDCTSVPDDVVSEGKLSIYPNQVNIIGTSFKSRPLLY